MDLNVILHYMILVSWNTASIIIHIIILGSRGNSSRFKWTSRKVVTAGATPSSRSTQTTETAEAQRWHTGWNETFTICSCPGQLICPTAPFPSCSAWGLSLPQVRHREPEEKLQQVGLIQPKACGHEHISACYWSCSTNASLNLAW